VDRRVDGGEQLLADAEDGREGQQAVLVDQVGFLQRPYDAQTAGDDHITGLLTDDLGQLSVEQFRVRPRGRIGQRPRCDQLGHLVQQRRELVTAVRPDPAEQLPGGPPEQHHPAVHHRTQPELVPGDTLRPVPERPPSDRRTTRPVRIRHNPVQADELDDDNATHEVLLDSRN